MSAGLTPACSKAAAPDHSGRRPGEVDPAAVLALHRLAGADHLHHGTLEIPRDLGPRHHQRAAAVAHHAAVETMQRVGDHRRVEHVLHRHHLAQHRVRVVLRVVGGGDLDPRQLLAGRAELVHVAHRHHGVHVDRGAAVGNLECRIGRRGAVVARLRAARALRARPPGERDQRDVAAAGGDGLRRMRDVHEVGGAAGLRGVHVAHLEPQVVEHRQRTQPRRVAGAEVAVDLLAVEPGVGQRAVRDLGVQLRGRLVRRLARRMLERPGDAGFSLDRHRMAAAFDLALSSTLIASGERCAKTSCGAEMVRIFFSRPLMRSRQG